MLIWCLAGCAVAAGTLRVVFSWLGLRAHQHLRTRGKRVTDRIVLIVPVFGNSATALESAHYLGRMVAPPGGHELWFVGTTRDPSRCDLVLERELATHGPGVSVRVLTDGAPAGFKAHQVNLAFRQLAGSDYGPNTIVGVYDVDARPELTTLSTVAGAFDADPAGLFVQQFVRFDARTDSAFAEAAALRQTAVELRGEAFHSIGGICAPLRYVIGSGLFARARTWGQIGGFPVDVWSDDLLLPLLIAKRRWPVHLIPEVASGDVPVTVGALVAQAAVWFRTPAFELLPQVWGLRGELGWRFVAVFVPVRLARNILWLTESVLVSALLVAPLIERQGWHLLLGVTAVIVLWSDLVVAARAGRRPRHSWFALLIARAMASGAFTLGALCACHRYAVDRARASDSPKTPTPHDRPGVPRYSS